MLPVEALMRFPRSSQVDHHLYKASRLSRPQAALHTSLAKQRSDEQRPLCKTVFDGGRWELSSAGGYRIATHGEDSACVAFFYMVTLVLHEHDA